MGERADEHSGDLFFPSPFLLSEKLYDYEKKAKKNLALMFI